MKCEAKTKEGKRCTLNASAEVGAHHFCGNHANIARETQLRHSDLPMNTEAAVAQDIEPRGPFIPHTAQQQNAARILRLLRELQAAGLNDEALVQVLASWKAGGM